MKSLKKEGIRENLLNFHKKWYSANIMNLVVTGKHSVDQLEQWIREKFAAVPNKDITVPDLSLPVHPFPADHLGKLNRVNPVKDQDQIELLWILPNLEREWRSKTLDYYSHLFGHEGENSLLSYLKQEDLAMELGASCDHEMDVFSSFSITITLTKKGLENTSDVCAAVFNYAK